MAEKESSPSRRYSLPEAAAQEKETMSREASPSASTRTKVDDDGETPRNHQQQQPHSEKVHTSRKSSDGYMSDETDHGEPDLEHEEAEETVPGRELDRQLSRVCSRAHSVSPCAYLYTTKS